MPVLDACVTAYTLAEPASTASATKPAEQFGADPAPLPGVLDDQRDLGLVAVPQEMAERHEPPRRRLDLERPSVARAQQMVEIAVRVADGAVVAQAQGAFRAALVHLRRRVDVALVGAAYRDLALGQRQDVPAARDARAEARVEFDQGARPGELRGGEGQVVALDADHAAVRVAHTHRGAFQNALDGGALAGRAAGGGDGGQ